MELWCNREEVSLNAVTQVEMRSSHAAAESQELENPFFRSRCEAEVLYLVVSEEL